MKPSLSLDFFKKELGGIYFGTQGIIITQHASGRMKSQYYAPYPVFGEEGAPGGASDDIFEVFRNKEIELAAFFQKAIRDSKLETSKVVVALSPKDLIIRFFEMPSIPRSEILAGINFEMKKYIPFKIEELAYDFQYRVKQKASIIEVILCAMRQEALGRYAELFKQLNLEVTAFEPGLFSLFRLLVARNKISVQQSYIILDFDQREANILIVEKGFTYFTRDIKLKGGPGAAKMQEDFDAILFRLINEIRVSLDYYRRQFLKKDVDEMVVVASKDFSSWTDNFSKELGLKVNFINLEDIFKIKDIRQEALFGIAKAYGAALRVEKPSLVTLNLGRPKEKGGREGLALPTIPSAEIQEQVFAFIKDSKTALIKGGMIGAIIFVVGYGFSFSKLFPLEKELAAASVKQMPLLPGVDTSSLESVQGSERVFMEKERELKKLTEGDFPFHKRLALLARLMPAGVWISDFAFTADPPSLRLTCYSYAEDEKKISSNMSKFIANLRAENDFAKLFTSIGSRSYREAVIEDVSCMQFDVICEKK